MARTIDRWTLEKRFTFEASHVLPHHDGKCRRLHGHSWRMRVGVRGSELIESGAKSGMLVDFGELSSIVKPLLDSHLDHHHLNDTTKLTNPTSEELARWIYRRLKFSFRESGGPIALAYVAVEETCTSSCLYMESA